MTPNELAAELGLDAKTLRGWLRREWPRDPAQAGSPWVLAEEQAAAARNHWMRGPAPTRPLRTPSPSFGPAGEGARDEHYVLGLVDDVLGSRGSRQHRFEWLLGDPGSRGAVRLPVDGYWPDHRLVVEYRERQHDEPVPFFDKPGVLTVSGVHRGEQRRIYDQRRDTEIPRNGLRLVVVRPGDFQADRRGRLLRDRERDLASVRALLNAAGVIGS